MTPILIPHWLAEKARQKYGYLPEGFADAYWYDLNQESQERINEKLRLFRRWNLVSKSSGLHQERIQKPHA